MICGSIKLSTVGMVKLFLMYQATMEDPAVCRNSACDYRFPGIHTCPSCGTPYPAPLSRATPIQTPHAALVLCFGMFQSPFQMCEELAHSLIKMGAVLGVFLACVSSKR